jgi:pimeloyl-ACP methyl ester carboxylesterase
MRSGDRVISRDGTSISYEAQGRGPALILVTGGLDDGSENTPLARELSPRFTVFNYARRGRAPSGDTRPYAVEREIEDIEALIARAGGSAHLYGVSSGGALVLEAALAGVAADRLAVYEVPFDLARETAEEQRKYAARLEALLAKGERGRALELFMRVAGSSDEMIRGARRRRDGGEHPARGARRSARAGSRGRSRGAGAAARALLQRLSAGPAPSGG